MPDDGSQSILPHLSAACDFISAQRARGGVLVHCKGGISRSPSVVVAFLMHGEGLSLVAALEVCSLARPAARPREIFLLDLEHYAAELAAAQEERSWERAAALATAEAVADLGPQVPHSWAEVQEESRRLAAALQDHCIRIAFGEPRSPREEFRVAVRAAVTSYAKDGGWIAWKVKQREMAEPG